MKISNILLWVVVLCLAGWLALSTLAIREPFGSVTVGNEYHSTSTIHTAALSSRLIKKGMGQLGSVVVTGAGTSAFTLFDATSTEAMNGGLTNTSTARLVTIPASLAAGTYVLDQDYTYGLFIYYDAIGTAPTSTITYR